MIEGVVNVLVYSWSRKDRTSYSFTPSGVYPCGDSLMSPRISSKGIIIFSVLWNRLGSFVST